MQKVVVSTMAGCLQNDIVQWSKNSPCMFWNELQFGENGGLH